MRLVFERMGSFSPTLVRRTMLYAVFASGERGPHPRAGFNRRSGDATERFQQQPESRVELIILPCQVNLVMARAAAEACLFVGLVRVEVAAAVGRHAVDSASVFIVQKETGAILTSGRNQSLSPANLAAVHHDRSRARQQVIKRKLVRVAVPEVFGDPPDIRREQKTRNEFAIDFAGAAIAYRALKTEFSSSI